MIIYFPALAYILLTTFWYLQMKMSPIAGHKQNQLFPYITHKATMAVWANGTVHAAKLAAVQFHF